MWRAALRLKRTAAILAVLSASAVCQNATANEEIATLYQLAIAGLENPEAVHRIASLAGRDTVRLLASIAGSNRPSLANRDAAVADLARVGTDDASESIAHLLAPHNPLALRESAARLIRSLPCSERCVESVLFYLYRRFHEGPSLRETAATNPSLRAGFVADEQKLVVDLRSLLLQHKRLTVSALALSYGLGTAEPSRFAIDTVEKLRLGEACDLLLGSESAQKQFKKFGVSDPTATSTAIDRLNCRTAIRH